MDGFKWLDRRKAVEVVKDRGVLHLQILICKINKNIKDISNANVIIIVTSYGSILMETAYIR